MNINTKKDSYVYDEELENLTKEELIAKVKRLTAHNVQLKSIISKSTKPKQQKKQKDFDFNKCTYRHILLKFIYLGWDYNGYAVQEDTINTIEHYLFEALIKTCLIKSRAESNYHRCGRTDKGVSSFGQVISIDVRSKLTKESQDNLEEEIDYCAVLNRVLPDNIQCICWSPVRKDFSARFDCQARTYKYFFPKAELNIDRMEIAAKYLVGTHDFRNFCKMDVGNGVVHFIRNIESVHFLPFTVSECNDAYSIYVATIKGKAFLWHQIRSVMGVLFLIGTNKEEPTIVKDLLDVEKNSRKPDYNIASEIPLNLYDCEYEGEIEWQINSTVLNGVLEKLRKKWTFSAVQTAMVKSMILDLEGTSNKDDINRPELSSCLLQGVKRKCYVPLMRRQKCGSLEDKIKHFVKRNRLEMKQNE